MKKNIANAQMQSTGLKKKFNFLVIQINENKEKKCVEKKVYFFLFFTITFFLNTFFFLYFIYLTNQKIPEMR